MENCAFFQFFILPFFQFAFNEKVIGFLIHFYIAKDMLKKLDGLIIKGFFQSRQLYIYSLVVCIDEDVFNVIWAGSDLEESEDDLFEATETSFIEMDEKTSNPTPEPNSSDDEGIPDDPEEELLSQYEGEDAMDTEDQDLNNGEFTAERIQEIMVSDHMMIWMYCTPRRHGNPLNLPLMGLKYYFRL